MTGGGVPGAVAPGIPPNPDERQSTIAGIRHHVAVLVVLAVALLLEGACESPEEPPPWTDRGSSLATAPPEAPTLGNAAFSGGPAPLIEPDGANSEG